MLLSTLWCAILGFSVVPETFAAPLTSDTPSNSAITDLERRWFSIKPGGQVQREWRSKVLLYCFHDAASQTKLSGLFDSGWQMWVNAGVSPDYATKSLISPCRQDALVVSATTGCEIFTSLGWSPVAWANTMRFDPSNECGFGNPVTNMAHEIGHSLGLIHEHQRSDASGIIKFDYDDCKNLKDYRRFKNMKNGKKPLYHMRSLCSNLNLASQAGFSARDMIPYTGLNAVPYVAGNRFDTRSIMLYSSRCGASPGGKDVLKFRDGSIIPPPTEVSRVDAERIRLLYPRPTPTP